MVPRPGVPAERSSSGGGRPNPEPFEGSLIWWVEVPAAEQAYLQAVLEGHDGLGYYQTLDPLLRAGSGGGAVALGRITSHPDAREEVRALVGILAGECGLTLLDRAPAVAPDRQPERARG